MYTPDTFDIERTELHDVVGAGSTLNRVVALSELALAHSEGSRLLGPHELTTQRSSSIHFFQTKLYASRIFGMAYGGSTEIVPCWPRDHYTVTAILKGAITVAKQTQGLRIASGQVICQSPGNGLVLNIESGTVVIGVRVPKAVLEDHLGVMCQRRVLPTTDLSFVCENESLATATLASLRQIIYLSGQSKRLSISVAKALEDALITNILIGAPQAVEYGAFESEVSGAALDYISKATEILTRDYANALDLNVIADGLGLNLRSLQSGFLKKHGLTPSGYLKEVRLQRAHEELKLKSPGDSSVAQIATAAGFTHLGRFSVDYKMRFGVTPTETLRNLSNH